MSVRILLAAAVTLGLVAETSAQVFPGQRRNPREQPKMERFEASGTIAGIGRGQIQMVTATQQKWIVMVAPQASIHVTGTADPNYLKVGQFIRFNAAMDKKGKIEEPVGEVTLYTPSAEFAIGIWPEGMAVGDLGAEEPKHQPAPNPFGGGNFGAGNPGAAQPASNRYMIAGRITGSRKGKMFVNFGRGVAEFELAENPVVNVDFGDYTAARQGDAITVSRGKTYPNQFQMMQQNPNFVGRAMAEEIEIQLSEPLSVPGKKPPRGAAPKQPPAAGEPAPIEPGGAPGEENPFGDQ